VEQISLDSSTYVNIIGAQLHFPCDSYLAAKSSATIHIKVYP